MSNGFKFDTSKLLNALVSREMKTKAALGAYEIGRASCRERVLWHV